MIGNVGICMCIDGSELLKNKNVSSHLDAFNYHRLSDQLYLYGSSY